MRLSRNRRLAFLRAISPLFLLLAGCGGTEVQLKKEPMVQIPESKPPDEQPKHLRPRSGSSSGMNYDPSGVTPK
jgi:hypothetical protein